MGGKKKNKDEGADVVFDGLGRMVQSFQTSLGKTFVKEFNPSDFAYTGEAWCPECHTLAEHLDGYWRCSSCGYTITDEELEEGDGCPTREATYEDDYGEYYDEEEYEEDEDEFRGFDQ